VASVGASPSDASSGESDAEATVGEGPLDPGQYSSDTTGAEITFSLSDETWEGAPDLPEVGFALVAEFGWPAITSLSVTAFHEEVFGDACDPSAPTEAVEETPEAFMEWLGTVPGVEAAQPTEVTVGGRPGLVTDLTTALPAECTDPPWIFLWTLPEVGDFHFADDATVRLWAIQGAKEMVLLVAEAEAGADVEAFQAAVDEILETMTID